MTVTGMAWHLLLPCHTERGEPGSRPFPNSCPDLRKADCSFAQAEVQSRRGFASSLLKDPGWSEGCFPSVVGGRGLLIAALERLPCQVDRAVDLGCS